MNLPFLRSFALALIATAVSLPGTVAAQTPTVIDRLPYTISVSGLYVLTSDLNSNQTNGNLITLAAPNVTIDMQGHFISGPVNGGLPGPNGIYGNEVNNVTVRNGTVANVRTGIYLSGNNSSTTNNRNHELDHLRVTRCLSNGIYLIYAASASITNCKLSFIGDNSGGAVAINIAGPGVTVQNCAISQGVGLFSTGIRSDAGSFSRQNTISNYAFGVVNGTYQDNLTYGCTTPFSGGTDAGGNN